ncbi:MAG: response regulator transcription factor [Halieaceae bacterium]|uniref:response regulator n=1 Tax=Haliea alexandrii TaxID=2448162 RepID=UPI000F0AFEA0|nr:response regulator transcription factor [Haliea alexandrii]MCR9184020.1 response regulator transcription factor [Halieaceae bacterium]
MKDITIVVAEDHEMLRSAIVAYLSSINGFNVVAEAADGDAAIAETRRTKPDVLVLDLQLPKKHGLIAIKETQRMTPKPAVVVVSMHSQTHFVRQAFEAGALGYLLKEAAVDELGDAIQTVLSGKAFTCRRLKAKLSPQDARAALSIREEQVLRLIGLGRSTREIATQLHLSVKTIESHRKHIMDKLELYSVAELTRYCLQTELIDS